MGGPAEPQSAGAVAASEHGAVVESARFRHVIGHLAGGVTVVTMAEGEERQGMTASSVTSLSIDPPTLICCLNKRSSTGQAIARAKVFAVNILEEGQADLAENFALNKPSEEKFSGVALVEDPSGQPLLADALAHLTCRVREVVDGGTHYLFVSEVSSAETRPGRPLAYYRGVFGHFTLDEDVTVRERLRDALLAGVLQEGRPLDLSTLQQTLGASSTALDHALRELASEHLLRRDPDSGWVAADPTGHDADRGRARHALELGALAGSAGSADTDWDGLRRAVEAASAALAAGHREAIELHLGVHASFAALAESPSLEQTHRRLATPVGRRTPVDVEAAAPLLSKLLECDGAAIAAAESLDLDALRAALDAHAALEEEDRVTHG
ncbi:MAG: transcriptional regulator, GntR family [Acidimicrobiaceae bacterium]|nr:transcriptional regulator, GntR family [Acidimicrobiaceae bacterium]